MTVDRYFEHIDIMVACAIIVYSAIGVGVGYIRDITALFVVFWSQGLLEQWLGTGGLFLRINISITINFFRTYEVINVLADSKL